MTKYVPYSRENKPDLFKTYAVSKYAYFLAMLIIMMLIQNSQ